MLLMVSLHMYLRKLTFSKLNLCSLLPTICFTDAAKLAKNLFLQFQYKTYFIVPQQITNCFRCCILTRRYLVRNLYNEGSPDSAFTSSFLELQIATIDIWENFLFEIVIFKPFPVNGFIFTITWHYRCVPLLRFSSKIK
jgi:hypothetical protein